MHGVVSLLDDEHVRMVEGLWAELAETFGVRGVSVTPYPHFSYHVAGRYDLGPLEATLRRLARTTAPFRVMTSGLGVFTGGRPVLYVPVARTAELSRLHDGLWHEVSRAAAGIVEYYRPEAWFPHITLAHGDLGVEELGQIVRAFGGRSFDWEIAIDNLALIYDTGTKQELRIRVDLTGS